MTLSVIASIYAKESPVYLREALDSISKQTTLPDEVVIVLDGHVSDELLTTLYSWKDDFESEVIILPQPINKGLAISLNIALSHCCGEYIARIDTDDICLPTRFEEQLDYFNSCDGVDVDVVGSNIIEIDSDGYTIKDEVVYPESHNDCFAFFSKRDPLAHPATMFRKSFFEKAGFYNEKYVGVRNYEDTILWYQGFTSGCKFANIQKPLLKFRRTDTLYKRRGGVKKAAYFFLDRVRIIRRLNFSNSSYFFAICYFVVTVSPSFIKRLAYNYLR